MPIHVHGFRGILSIVGLFMLLLPSTTASSSLTINEILPNPGIVDANRDGTANTVQDEFVELINLSESPMSLSGWHLSDTLRVRHTFALDAVIPGYGFFLVFGGGTPIGFSYATIASSGRLALNNDGDTLTFQDDNGILIDRVTYESSNPGIALTRFPDGTGPWLEHITVSSLASSPGTTAEGISYLSFLGSDPIETPQPTVPEPSSLMLLSLSIAALLGQYPFVRRYYFRNASGVAACGKMAAL